MQTTNRLSLVLALALGSTAVGCGAADPSSMPGGDDGGGSGGAGGGGNQKPLDATGTYTMHSTFDLATNMPGKAGEVVTTIIQATDDPNDPTQWILDQIINALPNGAAKTALGFGESLAAGYLNQQLLNVAPDFFSTMVQVGADFGDIAKHFGLNETLQLTGSGGSYTAIHTVTGVHFKLGNQETDYAFANYHMPNIVASDVAVTMDDTGQLTIAAHNVSLTYGKILHLGLDAAIIPLIDPSAHNLNELLAHKIDCAAIGSGIAGALSISFAAGTITSACTVGLNAVATVVYTKIDGLDSTALQFGLSGTAKGTDRNNDRTIDTIVTGSWTGTLAYGSAPSPLVPAAFFGERK
jgi:hypothetical protein